jgi:hypothetical protein
MLPGDREAQYPHDDIREIGEGGAEIDFLARNAPAQGSISKVRSSAGLDRRSSARRAEQRRSSIPLIVL